MLTLYGKKFTSRLLLGTAQYPSLAILKNSIINAKNEIITISIRRELNCETDSKNNFWQYLQNMNLEILPNTAGCYSAKEAIITAHCAREIFNTNWIKLEIIANEDSLQPNVFELLSAAKTLIEEGFCVFPYTTDDVYVAEQLFNIGCQVIMPWGAPIGSARGLQNIYNLRSIRAYLPEATLILDAGIGKPSHATEIMELGYDAVLLNSAIAKATHPEQMALAFNYAIQAGYLGFRAGLLTPRDMASPSTPLLGKACFE